MILCSGRNLRASLLPTEGHVDLVDENEGGARSWGAQGSGAQPPARRRPGLRGEAGLRGAAHQRPGTYSSIKADAPSSPSRPIDALAYLQGQRPQTPAPHPKSSAWAWRGCACLGGSHLHPIFPPPPRYLLTIILPQCKTTTNRVSL